MTVGLGPRLAGRYDFWPRVPHDEFYGRWASSTTPMLMINGELDPATPVEFAMDAATAFSAMHQTFVAMPLAGHGALADSPVNGPPQTPACGVQLFTDFLQDPTSLDTTCVGEIRPFDFERSPASRDFFGTDDLWGN